MADRIRGITIEIGGDATKLSAALQKTDASIRKTQGSLRDINKLLKLDPGNTTLLQQKYKELGSQIDNTRDRLAKLKDAERQMAGSDMTAEQREQYEKLQREIIETEQKLKGLNDEMKDFGSVGAQKIALAGENVEKFGGTLTGVGEKITGLGTAMTAVTGVITGAAALAVSSWQEVDSAYDTIIKKTGATGEELADMEARAESLATTIPTSFDTAGKAVGAVNSRFDLNGNALEKLAGKYIKFADLNNADVSGAIDTTQKAMAAWNIASENAGDYLDILNGVAQKTGVNVLTIASSAATNAASLKELGYNAGDAAVFLAGLEKNGVDASTVMTGLKRSYADAIKNGTDMSDSLAGLEERLKNQDTYSEAAAEAIELFGSRAGGALAEAVASGRLSFAALDADLQQYAGNVERTFEATLDPLDELQTQMNQVKSAGADLVEAAGPLISDMLGKATGVIEKITNALKSLTDEQKQSIIKTATVVAAVGPALVVGGKAVSLMGNAVTGAGKLMQSAPKIVSAVKTVKAAVLGANPAVLAAVAAVTALTAAGVYFVGKAKEYIDETYGMTDAQKALCEQIQAEKEAWEETDSARKEAVGKVQDEYGYYEDLVEELQAITDENGRVKDGYETRAAVITGILSDAMGTEITMTDGVIDNYGELIGTIDDLIRKKEAEAMLAADEEAYKEALMGKADAQLTYSQAVADAAEQQEKYNQAAADLSKALMTGGGALDVSMSSAALKKAGDDLENLKQAAADAEETYYGYLNTIANHNKLLEAAQSGEALNLAMQNVADGFKSAGTATQGMLETQVQEFQDAYDKLQRAATTGIGNVTQAQLTEAQEKLGRAKVELERKVKMAAVDFNNTATTAMAGTQQGNAEPARQVVDQYAAAMEGEKGTAEAAASTVAGAATDELEGAKWKKSWWQSGVNWVTGLISGMNSKKKELNDTAQGLADTVANTTKKGLKERSPSDLGDEIGQNWDLGIIGGMEKLLSRVRETSAKVAGAVSGAMTRYPEIQAQAAQAYTGTAARTGAAKDYGGSLDTVIGLLGQIASNGRRPVYTPDGGFMGWLDSGLGESAALAARGV